MFVGITFGSSGFPLNRHRVGGGGGGRNTQVQGVLNFQKKYLPKHSKYCIHEFMFYKQYYNKREVLGGS